MSAAGSLELIAIELSELLKPLAQELAPGNAKGFFHQIGVTLTDAQISGASGPLNTAAGQVSNLLDTITKLIPAIAASDFGAMASAVGNALNAISQILNGLSAVGTALAGAAGMSANQLTKRIFDFAAFHYLEKVRVNEFLELSGVLDREDHPGDPVPFTIATYHFERLGDLFTNPFSQLRTQYGWGNGFDPKKLFTKIEEVVARANFPVIYDSTGAVPKLDLVLFEAVPKTDTTPHGLLITLKATLPLGDQEMQLGPNSKLNLKLGFQPPLNTVLAILPNTGVTLTPPTQGPPFSGTLQAQLAATRTNPPGPFLLFGSADGSRVQLGKFLLTAGLETAWTGSTASGAFSLTGEAEDLTIVIDTSSADGFLAKILPSTHIEANLSVQMGISTAEGFFFNGSTALQVRVPTHLEVGPISIEGLTISAALAAGTIPVSIGADIRAELGPLVALVQNIGFRTTFSFRGDNSGNLGPLQFGLSFKPPDGAGLSLDAGIVKGGGFLLFDPDHGQYAGALELVFADFLSLDAIGLITTIMPDGSRGFSLLVIITADFGSGIQLGFGFTLLAVGGLLGLNRTMLLQPLMDGIRTGAIESVLFPKNVIANAMRIISDLQAIFPPKEGNFLIGPMAKLGWGEPTLVSLSLGVIIEIPGNLAIIGILKVALPADELAIIVLQVNFAGAIEFDKQRVFFFAALFDSHILFITLEGEMGLLFGWGDNANFVVSVGGFHPQFNPPALPFPNPRRIEVDIINESFARIRCDGYFAVTSNTLQFGSHSEYFFGFSALNVQGSSGFDALIQFSPFHFIVTISTSFSVHVFGIGCYGVDIDLLLEGPTPWHAHGTASLSFFLFSVDIGIDFTWGDSRNTQLPPVEVMPILAGELQKRSNWRALLPQGSNLSVSLRQLDPEEAAIVLHPVGTLRISQRAIPLDLTLDKMGNQAPSDANRFALDVSSAGLAKSSTLKEQFAPAQFKNLDDATKLSQPAFVPQDSGIELSATGNLYASGTAITRNVRYDLTIIDTKLRRVFQRFFTFNGALFTHFLKGSAVARSPLSAFVQTQKQPFAEKVVIAAETFAVANVQDNTVFHPDAAAFTSQVAAHDYMARTVVASPEKAGTLHVIAQYEVAA
jgi:hypothetical protein